MSVPGNLYTPTIRKTRGGDYLIEQSLLFNDDDSAYLSRTPSTAGNRKTWSFDCWVKRAELGRKNITRSGNGAGSEGTNIEFDASNRLRIVSSDASVIDFEYVSSMVFRDMGAWYHLAVIVDTTAGTASDRVKAYVNGTQITAFDTANTATLNYDTWINDTTYQQQIGYGNFGGSDYFSGYIAYTRLIDGAAVAITDLLTFNDDNTIQPKEFTGTTTSQNTFVDPTGLTKIGDLVDAGGLAAAFDGNTSQDTTASARKASTTDGFVGVDHGVGNSETIGFVEAWPSNANGWSDQPTPNVTLTLYGSNTAPSTPSDGTSIQALAAFADDTSKRSFVVTSPSTAYRYHWLRIQQSGSADTMYCAELKLYSYAEAANSFGTNGALLTFANTSKLGEDTSGTTNANNLIPQDWGSVVGNCTSGGGLAAAFDGSVNTAANSARVASSATATVGKNWGSDTFTVTKFVVKTPSDDNFGGGSPATVKLQGSNDGSAWDDLYTNASVTNTGVAIVLTATSGINTSSAYQYHRVEISNTGSPSNSNIAEVEFYGTISNSFSASGFVTTDQLADSPTDDADLGIGNYATLNPLTKQAHVTLANGNKNITASDVTVAGNSCAATIGNLNTGKWFWFASLSSFGADSGCGVYDNDLDFGSLSPNSGSINNYGAGLDTTTAMRRFAGGTSVSPDVSLGFTADLSNDYQVYALDADNGYFWAGIYDASANTIYWIDWPNNDMTGDPTDGGTTGVSISGDNWTPFAWTTSSASSGINIYFDHADFPGTVPTGYSAIATQNLPAVAVSNPKDHFDVVTDAGADIKDTAFATFASNDCIAWIKDYANAQNWQFVDSVRGTSVAFSQHTTTAQAAYSAPSGTSIAYVWKAGTGGGVSNTDGSITATVSANTTAGVSIVYVNAAGTGAAATIGHGLGQAPALIIGKRLDSTGTCRMYHQKIGATKSLAFDASAPSTSSAYWNDTAPTSTVFTVGSSSDVNASGGTYVFYCFAEVPGFSVFDTYVGNASTNGPFMYADFKPAMSMEFNIAGGDNWFLHDEARHTTTLWDYELAPNTTSAHSFRSGGVQRIYANGAKITQSSNAFNPSGGTCIRIAFGSAAFAGGSTNITQGRAAY